MNNLVDKLVQCWGCEIFDRLFQIVSTAGAALYERMTTWAFVVLIAFWVFYSLWVVYQNLTEKQSRDWLYQESVKPAFINTLIVCVLLGIGVQFPKLITSLSFEPVAGVASAYTEAVLDTTAEVVEKKITYSPQPMPDEGFFRPELRDKIVHLMKATITQFQLMIKLGIAVMDNAFSIRAIIGGIGMLLKHVLMFIMGAYLVYRFFMLFMRFCFYFVDVIVNLTLFAFFFPFMLVFFIFQHSEAGDWVKNMGKGFTPKLFENVIRSIVALSAAVLTYTIVMVIIAKFFASDAMSSNELVRHVLAGTVSEDLLDNDNLTNLTLLSCIVIGFLISYLTEQIPVIAKDLFEAFGVKNASAGHALGDDVGKKAEGAVKNLADDAAKKIKALAGDKKE